MDTNSRALSLIANGIFVAATYLGFVQGLKWLQYVVIGIIWIMLFLYLVVFLSTDIAEKHRQQQRKEVVPRWFEWLEDIALLAMLIFGHAFLSALVFVASCVVLEAIQSRKGKHAKEPT